MIQDTPYPASFGGDPYTFGWALFSLFAISSFTLATFLSMVREAMEYGWRLSEPIGISRTIALGWLATMFLGAIGDTVTLLAWGEVSGPMMNHILAFDRYCDMLCFVPFAISGFFLVRGRHVVVFSLVTKPIPADIRPTWNQSRRHILIAALIVFIAYGVTIGK